MSCLPPEQMPFGQEGRCVVLYPSYAVGVSEDHRGVAMVFNHPHGQEYTSPALLLSEKETVRLILQLQGSLQVVRQLPISSFPLD